MAELIQTSLIAFIITKARFVLKEHTVLKDLTTAFHALLELIILNSVQEDLNNAHYVQLAHPMQIMALKDAPLVANLQQVTKVHSCVLVLVKIECIPLRTILVDANQDSISNLRKV